MGTKDNKNTESTDSIFSASNIEEQMPTTLEGKVKIAKPRERKQKEVEDVPVTIPVQQKTPPPAPEFIYYVYFAEDESDLYTKTPPTIEGSRITLYNVIQKVTISEAVMGKQISVDYNASGGAKEKVTRELFGSHGFLLKVMDNATVDLSWIHKTIEDAQAELKDQKLNIYDQVVPEMFNKMNQIQQQQQQRQEMQEDFDDYDEDLHTPQPRRRGNNKLMGW